ncbi:YfhE family protein [Halobacillus shinanisalinarum]|uniref:YfhE family protein n=1 Tax=Halobacillus shinanisalinarum TaxID=2932258 RepID=A0ABY4GY54_9BACI|nr:YfhE family protein [Halobacillus shinanisalinarum]UOQ93132.1 YfhE family protein [Halobacillus shinanisalinarum]
MARKAQYQPVAGNEPSDAQEVNYAKEFKQADIAGGYRRDKVKEVKNENPNSRS